MISSVMMPRRLRTILPATALLAAALLVAPAPSPTAPTESEPKPFRWDADLLFAELQDEYLRAGQLDLVQARVAQASIEVEADRLLRVVAESASTPFEALGALANLQFRVAVLGAAHPSLLPSVQDLLVRSRVDVMRTASRWPMDRAAHESIYRVLFGGRMALDEALVQAGTEVLPALVRIEDVPSEAPSIVVEGVRIHSGDILLSRGGAPTSALIARGNDFPNTFSHAALAHVDAETGVGTVIESLIETGSVLSTVEEYLESKKHRILVLRLRPDHPALAADPLVPHRAAQAMLDRVREQHVQYDFAMDWQDPTRAFCSEIVFHAYGGEGVDLWTVRSSVSSPGLIDWLSVMGVREFTSLVPSDIEYDPQVRAVVEWRDAPALMDYRLDNATIDALIEEAEAGGRLGYHWYALPVARLLKAWSIGQDAVGVQPTIPQGMSASAALRVDALVSSVHPTVKEDLSRRAEAFLQANGFEAPYWTLVDLARDALAAHRGELPPALAR
jgi:hypothetical protein